MFPIKQLTVGCRQLGRTPTSTLAASRLFSTSGARLESKEADQSTSAPTDSGTAKPQEPAKDSSPKPKKFSTFSSRRPFRPWATSDKPYFKISPEVRDAINAGRPVLALESAIYTHGYPKPENYELARALETLAREQGVIPATIGIVDGVATVGLSDSQLQQLTESAGGDRTVKVSRRDIAHACSPGPAGKLSGGTTVAATMLLARQAGIRVVATGGLGGVHRGGESSFDISADISELGRTPVAVVCSGCKSFLDIGRTLEMLETQGVAVATFDRDLADETADQTSDLGPAEFPAFWSRKSGFTSPLTVSSSQQAAAMILAQSGMRIGSSIVFANPIPAADEIPLAEMESIISQALSDAEAAGVANGRDNTPFVLARIRELTEGRSVAANTALARANVERGARIARHVSELRPSRAKDGLESSPEL